jgi:hypothetical protein
MGQLGLYILDHTKDKVLHSMRYLIPMLVELVQPAPSQRRRRQQQQQQQRDVRISDVRNYLDLVIAQSSVRSGILPQNMPSGESVEVL